MFLERSSFWYYSLKCGCLSVNSKPFQISSGTEVLVICCYQITSQNGIFIQADITVLQSAVPAETITVVRTTSVAFITKMK